MRWLLALVVLAALGAGAWLVLGEPHADDAALEAAEARREEEARQGPTLAGGGSGSRSSATTKGRCAIECRVVRDGKPAIAVVEARRIGGAEVAEGSRSTASSRLKALFAPPAPPTPATASATSDATGRATLAGLAPGFYRLAARGPDGTRANAYARLAVEGVRSSALLELVSVGLVLDARVTWSDGRPAPGTLVLTRRSETPVYYGVVAAGGDDGTHGAIAADGSAKVEGLSAGIYDVRALLGEVVVSGPNATLPATGVYVLTIQAPGQQVSGRVLDSAGDVPVAGASVLVQARLDERWSSYLTRATADADGRFALTVPKTTGGSLTVEAPGFATASRALTAAQGELVVRLVRSARVAGRVTTSDGAPAVGAIVVASGEGNMRGMPSAARIIATADRDGRYALEGLTPGDAQIVVKGGGWVSPGLADAKPGGFNPFVQRVPAAGAITLDLTAVRAAKIDGRVVDAAGAPVAGAAVVAGPGAGRSPSFGRYEAGDPDSATTDGTGAFVLESLTPDTTYHLSAEAPDQAPAKAGPFTVASGASTQVEIRFASPRYVDVLVLFEGEETPAAGARVLAMMNNAAQTASVTTDADGRARVGPAGEGVLSLMVYGPMVAVRNQGSPVEGSEDGPGPYSVTVHIPRGLTVEGRVLKADGTPAAGATVEIEQRWRAPGASDVTTAADGTFRLAGLGAGSQGLRATWRGPGDARLTGKATAVGGARDVSITLGTDDAKPMETFKFHVLDDRGEPVASAQVRLTHENGSSGTTVSDGWGTLQTSVGPESSLGRALAKGTAFLDVSDARGPDGVPLAAGPARVGPLAADQREIEVRLPGERSIEGRVVASEGARLVGVLVTARAVQKSQASQARTDANGRFRVGALGEGDYLVSVAAAPEYVAVPTATVASGTKDHLVRLKLGATARIRVTDAGGKPVSGASVYADPPAATPPGGGPSRGVPMAPPPPPSMRGGGEEWSMDGRGGWSQRGGGLTTTEDGTALLRGLDGDLLFTLRVQAPTGRDDVRPFRQERWSPSDTDVRLERGYVVAGSVRDASGKLVEGARLERKVGEAWQHAGMNRDGTFRIVSLEAGPVVLRATGPGARRPAGEGATELTVQAGNERVVLVVDPGLKLTVRVANLGDRKEEYRSDLNAVLLQWQEGRWSQVDRSYDRQGTGTAVFLGVKADVRYAVWIAPRGDDLFGWAADLRPGEVNVRLERGGTIRGRLTGATGVSSGQGVRAYNQSGLSVSGTVDAEGRYEIKGLPDGRWTVSAWANADGKQYRASGEAQTGATVDLALQAQGDAPPMAVPATPALR